MARNNDVLVGYCDQDKIWLAHLAKRLDQQKSDGAITQWQDSVIPAGEPSWLETNKALITDTKVVVFLGSPHLFNSDFSRNNGLVDFLARAKLYDLTVLWLAVGVCPTDHPLSSLQPLNTNPAMPLTAFPSAGSGLHQELLEVSDKIEHAVTDWNNTRRAIEDLLDGPPLEDPGPESIKEPTTDPSSAPPSMSRTVKIATGQTDVAGDSFKVIFERQQRHFDKDCTLLLYVGTNADLVKISFQDKAAVVLGRASDNATPDIDLTPFFDREYGVSRNHLRIHLANNQLFITDLKSVNKTHVNGEILPPGAPRTLENGDLIRLGMMLVVVRFERPEGFS